MELERIITEALGVFLRDEVRIIEALDLVNANPSHLRAVLHQAAATADKLNDRKLLRLLLDRITVRPKTICIAIRHRGLYDTVYGANLESMDLPEGVFEFTVPVLLKRRGVEAKLIIGATNSKRRLPDTNLIILIARAHLWCHQLITGEVRSINEVAQRDDIHASDVGRIMHLAFLAPDIVEAILAGCQPAELTAQCLKRIGIMPFEWDHQRRRLGFPA
jgi:hypothetical protein